MISIDCERCSATDSRSESSTITNSPFATSQPLTSSSGSTSRSWCGHHRFCLIGVPHSRCRVRNATSDRWVARASPIGMLTRPKLIDPFQMVRMGDPNSSQDATFLLTYDAIVATTTPAAGPSASPLEQLTTPSLWRYVLDKRL